MVGARGHIQVPGSWVRYLVLSSTNIGPPLRRLLGMFGGMGGFCLAKKFLIILAVFPSLKGASLLIMIHEGETSAMAN